MRIVTSPDFRITCHECADDVYEAVEFIGPEGGVVAVICNHCIMVAAEIVDVGS